MKKTANTVIPGQWALLRMFAKHGKPLRLEAIQRITKVQRRNKKELARQLQAMTDANLLLRLPGGFYSLPETSPCVIGEFTGAANGSGNVRVTAPADMRGREIHIFPQQVNGAWNRDIVRVALLPGTSGAIGAVVEVRERRQIMTPALLEKKHKCSLIFRAADGKLDARFRVDLRKDRDSSAKPGDLAILKPEKSLEHSLWQAELLEWRGAGDRIAAQEEIVKRSRDVPGDFPALALEQARALPPQPDIADIPGREDLRHIPFVTIDGADARDFDDAIHVEQTSDGYLLRVAIADVSHYVQPDDRPGSLDQEARARGNSWYFPRSCEPMLPHALCNGLCSLRPGEDRLAILAELPFNKAGEPLAPRFAPAVIRSRSRLIYDDVARFFAGSKNAVPDNVQAMLMAAHGLYEILAQKRRQRGSLDFQMPEPDYEFDASGHLVAMREAERTDANQLIEEFMIAANEAVATFLGAKGAEFLYRIHPAPESDKLQKLLESLKLTSFGILPPALRKASVMTPADIQPVLAAAAGSSQEYVINRLCLRSMGQARYQPQNVGHFGLASPAYCHFTSPIRRYADLLVHRALKTALGEKNISLPDRGQLTAISDDLSELERRAADCEREITRRMACLALDGREGQKFAGTVSGVTDFGVFVEFADLPADGLMRMDELGDEWFELDQARQIIIGQQSGRIWRLGQPVQVVLVSVDVEKQEIRLRPFGAPEKLAAFGRRKKHHVSAFHQQQAHAADTRNGTRRARGNGRSRSYKATRQRHRGAPS